MMIANDLWVGWNALQEPPPASGPAAQRCDHFTAELQRERARRAARRHLDVEEAAQRGAELDYEPVAADVDELPISLAGDRTSLTADELQLAMKTRPVTLLDALRVAREAKPRPSLLEMGDGGHCLFYRGKSNWLSGESGEGKSTIAKMAVYQEAVAGRAALFLDREKDVTSFADSMVELGDLTDEQAARVFYWSPRRGTDQLMPVILGFARKYRIDLVVVDSCSRDIAEWSPTASENSNDDVRRWYNACVDPMVRASLTPLVIDHLRRGTTTLDGRPQADNSLYAKGATAKREVVTGLAAVLRGVQRFSRDQAGFAKCVCAKDNNGAYTQGETVCELHVTPGEQRSTYELRAGRPPVVVNGLIVPTALMERISQYLEAASSDVSTNQVITNVSGNEAAKKQALTFLAEWGYASAAPGPRNGTYYTSLKNYRQSDDPRVAAAPRTAPSTFGGGAAAGSWSSSDPF